MRSAALDAAQLDERRLKTLDAGAGTGFTTEGIVERVDADCVTMLDQSPQRALADWLSASPRSSASRKVLGDAEALPLADPITSTATSPPARIEYWPAPERWDRRSPTACSRPRVALVVGPVPPGDRILRAARRAVDAVPDRRTQYREWFESAGFEDVTLVTVAPEWSPPPTCYVVAEPLGYKSAAGLSPRCRGRAPGRSARARLAFAGRFVLLLGAVFVLLYRAGAGARFGGPR